MDSKLLLQGVDVNFETTTSNDCTPKIPENVCLVVNTIIEVSYSAKAYSEKYINLILFKEVKKYTIKQNIVSKDPEVKSSTATFTLRIKGVNSELKDPRDKAILEESVREFLKKNVSNDGEKPIYIDLVQVKDQSFRTGELVVSLKVTGEYLPPPDIEFEMLLSETYNDKGDKFLGILQNNVNEAKEDAINSYGSTYFENVSSVVIVRVLERSSGTRCCFKPHYSFYMLLPLVCFLF